MERRPIGLGFCAIAAYLLGVRYISAAIYGSGAASGGAPFTAFLESVGSGLTVASVVSLFIGIVYLVLGEVRR